MDLFTQPKTRHVVLAASGWLAGMVLLILAITDLFRQPFFEHAGLPILFLMLGATAAVARIFYTRFTAAAA